MKHVLSYKPRSKIVFLYMDILADLNIGLYTLENICGLLLRKIYERKVEKNNNLNLK